MAVRSETLTLESVARALELARRDVEAVLAESSDWQAAQALAEHASTVSERNRLAARLALVPAYRAHTRITEALRQLSAFAIAQSADRANGWGGEIPASAASLQRANAETERGRRHEGSGFDVPPLSGWQAGAEHGADHGAEQGADHGNGPDARMKVDLDLLISRIRKGAGHRGPLPLTGLLAEVAAVAPAGLTAGPHDEALAFPPRAPSRDVVETAPVPEPVELTPVSPWNETRRAEDNEIVVEDQKTIAIAAAATAMVRSRDPLEQLNAMEAEIGVLEAGVARPLPPRPAGVSVPPGFDPASVDLGEALVEIVRKPRDKQGDIIDVPVEDADDADALDGNEAHIEIVRRT